MRILHYTILILIASAGMRCSMDSKATLASLDRKVEAQIFLNDQQELSYTVSFDGVPVVSPSGLGFILDTVDYGSQIEKLTLVKQGEVDEQRPIVLKSRTVNNQYRFYHYEVEHPHGNYELQVRIYNEGFAFRYRFSNQDGQLHSEKSTWTIASNRKVWFFERPNDWKLKSYAGLWENTGTDGLPIISPTGPVQGKPLLFELSQGYMMITEAALYNYSGMRLKAIGDRRIQVNFTEGADGFSIDKGQLSPWRVVLLADDLDALTTNTMIANLNPLPDPAIFKNTDWIRPGKSVWSWWSKDENYMSIENEKEYIDYASRLDFEYALLDEGWEKWENKWLQLLEMSHYAKTKGVRLWVWKHSKDLVDPVVMELFLDSLQAVGVAGIKVDFMNSEAKEWVEFDERLLKACARRQLMVNFHGCQTSSGEYVTYPNELTREGIRGLELNIMGKPIPAWHNAALPFTRLATGPADYTPLSFSNPGETTEVHQLATAVIFDSPFQCMAENPAYFFETAGMSAVVSFLQELPVVWDETYVLPVSEIGKMAAFAKRSKDVWYVALINGESVPKNMQVDASFLPNGEYTSQRWYDDDSGMLNYEEQFLNSGDSLSLSLQANGGVVLKIHKQKE